jgi:hypothetical protein
MSTCVGVKEGGQHYKGLKWMGKCRCQQSCLLQTLHPGTSNP